MEAVAVFTRSEPPRIQPYLSRSKASITSSWGMLPISNSRWALVLHSGHGLVETFVLSRSRTRIFQPSRPSSSPQQPDAVRGHSRHCDEKEHRGEGASASVGRQQERRDPANPPEDGTGGLMHGTHHVATTPEAEGGRPSPRSGLRPENWRIRYPGAAVTCAALSLLPNSSLLDGS